MIWTIATGWPRAGAGTKGASGAVVNTHAGPDFVGSRLHEIAEVLEHRRCHRRGYISTPPSTAAAADAGGKWNAVTMPKLPPPPRNPPEQIAVLGFRRDHLAAIGGDDLGLEQIIADEAEFALEPATAAAHGEARQRQWWGCGRRSWRGPAHRSRHRTRPSSHPPRRGAVLVAASISMRFMPRRSTQTPSSQDGGAGYGVTATVDR